MQRLLCIDDFGGSLGFFTCEFFFEDFKFDRVRKVKRQEKKKAPELKATCVKRGYSKK